MEGTPGWQPRAARERAARAQALAGARAEFRTKYKAIAHDKEESKWMRQRWMAEYRNDPRGCTPNSGGGRLHWPLRRLQAPLSVPASTSCGQGSSAVLQCLSSGCRRCPGRGVAPAHAWQGGGVTLRPQLPGRPKQWGMGKPRLRIRSRAAPRARPRLRKQPLYLVCGTVVPILPTIDAAFKSVHMGARDNKCAPPGIGLHTLSPSHTPCAAAGAAWLRRLAGCRLPGCALPLPALSCQFQQRCWRTAGEEMLHQQVHLQAVEMCTCRCSAAARTAHHTAGLTGYRACNACHVRCHHALCLEHHSRLKKLNVMRVEAEGGQGP